MESLNWESSVKETTTHVLKKETAGTEPLFADMPVTVHEERLYADQSEKGGFSITRISDADEYRGQLTCHLWLNARFWASGEVNDEKGKDSILVNHIMLPRGVSVSCNVGSRTNFGRIAKSGFYLVEFFKAKELYNASDETIIHELRNCVAEACKKIPESANN